jgi:hypothetical protein
MSADAPPRPPLQGYNHNIKYGSRVYHVQTEDSGLEHPHLFTHLFFNGVIIATAKTDYSDLAKQHEHEPRVRKLMQEQHKRLMKQLRAGKLDAKISAMLGADEAIERRRGEDIDPRATEARAASAAPRDSETADSQTHGAPGRSSSATVIEESGPPSMTELAAWAGVVNEDTDQTEMVPDPVPAKEGSHPIATWVEPGELHAEESRTLRMVVGEQLDDDEPTLVGDRPVIPPSPPEADSTPRAEQLAAGRAGRAKPHAPPAPGTRKPSPRPPVRVDRPASRPDATALGRPEPNQSSSPVTLPTSSMAQGRQDARPAAAPPELTKTGVYGEPPRRPGSAARHPGAAESSPRPAPSSGVYQITVGGARPMSGPPATEQPRVIARPAVLVDRAPRRGSPSSIEQALSGVGARQHTEAPPRAAQQPTSEKPKRTESQNAPSLFGADLISERSLDDVILQYLSEDQE